MGSGNSRPPSPNVNSQPHSYFGEYRCSCGRFWSSTLSWPDAYQKCKHCKNMVYPHRQREVMPEDRLRDGNSGHPQELCERCASLGYYCANHNRRNDDRNVNIMHDNDYRREPEGECIIL